MAFSVIHFQVDVLSFEWHNESFDIINTEDPNFQREDIEL